MLPANESKQPVFGLLTAVTIPGTGTSLKKLSDKSGTGRNNPRIP